MQRLRPLLPFLLLLAVSVPVVTYLFSDTLSTGGVRLSFDDRSILAHSRIILTDLGLKASDRFATVSFQQDGDLLRQLQQTFGFRRANALARDTVPVYSWQIRWANEQSTNIRANGRNRDEEVQDVADIIKRDLSMQFDMDGRLIGFERKLADSVELPTASPAVARETAVHLLRTHARLLPALIDSMPLLPQKTINQPHRKDYQFIWQSRLPGVRDPVQVRLTVAGNTISQFEIHPEVPERFTKNDPEKIASIVVLFVYVAIGILMIVTAVRRLRSIEIGFRMAAAMGLILAVVFDLEIYLTMRGDFGWETLVALVVPPLFVGGGMVLIWAVAESVGREAWREKFVSFDLMAHGHFFHSRVGASVVRGIAIGTGALAVWLVLLNALDAIGPLGVSLTEREEFHVFTVALPSIYVISHGFYATAFEFAFIIVFIASFLRRYIRSTALLVVASALIMAFLHTGHMIPIAVGYVLQTAVAVLFLWAFTRYEGLTVLVGLMVFSGLQDAGALALSGHPSYLASAWFVCGFGLVSLLGGIATQFRGKEIVDFDKITPAFARHISERQRLQQELEIARTVQMSFLPKRNPVQYRLDIASRCAPALEVGGDYYDFIALSDTKLGVAIGDVSGKGTQAAFFMTLTKGFLNALAKVSESPAAILSQVNRLFYENVERGIFISMVYGIFDMAGQTLTLARAGHNPVIMRKSQAKDVESVNPMGLALGLDPGETFTKSIREVTIPFQAGDLFVFYTDGFPEAMNRQREEFGEDRLSRAVEGLAGGTASEVMEGIFRETKTFTGSAKQHDDMTIVVVKIQ
jgi:phosphoserine phosphatase RsbU/P